MNYLISFILQLPLYYFLSIGIITLTGLNQWWAIPIVVLIGLMHDLGEIIRKGNWED